MICLTSGVRHPCPDSRDDDAIGLVDALGLKQKRDEVLGAGLVIPVARQPSPAMEVCIAGTLNFPFSSCFFCISLCGG